MKLSLVPLILQIYVILVPFHFGIIFFSTWIFEEKVLSWLILIKFYVDEEWSLWNIYQLENFHEPVNWKILYIFPIEQHIQTNPEVGGDEIPDELGPTSFGGLAGRVG